MHQIFMDFQAGNKDNSEIDIQAGRVHIDMCYHYLVLQFGIWWTIFSWILIYANGNESVAIGKCKLTFPTEN